ncbi:hypothetical protein GBFDFA_09450 [Edwardsiella anguillarum]|nr:hypothetical protein PBOPBF_09455 [Edwardsiella anguillarum]BET84353.1 hypothetical protein GHNJMD_09760 [Edwardsiella anguillarum]BET87720.1 hypothetical protein GBFDFA_09450 [Edwardsiella anguillarum]BET91148.1 hypothetical protein BIKEJJ_09465 [Edwardsiella anguillarum]
MANNAITNSLFTGGKENITPRNCYNATTNLIYMH